MKLLITFMDLESAIRFRGKLIEELCSFYDIYIVTKWNSDGIKYFKDFPNINMINIDIDRADLAIAKNFSNIARYCRILKKIKPDILFSFDAKANILSILAGNLIRNRKKIILLTGLGSVIRDNNLYSNPMKSHCLREIYKCALRSADKVIVQNRDDYEYISKLRKKGKGIFKVNGSGIDLRKYDKSPIISDTFKFLYIGRLIKSKGIIELLKASRMMKEKYPEVEIEIIGDVDKNPGSLKIDDLIYYINNKYINYLGYRSEEEVIKILKKATVLVLPSYHEGIPRSVLEAMAIGRPIITTDAPGCKETVIDGYNGYLVKIGSYIDLFKKMELIYNQRDRIEIMGERSREKCKNEFDIKIVNKQMISIILET